MAIGCRPAEKVHGGEPLENLPPALGIVVSATPFQGQ
jgi:hypothetical protein